MVSILTDNGYPDQLIHQEAFQWCLQTAQTLFCISKLSHFHEILFN